MADLNYKIQSIPAYMPDMRPSWHQLIVIGNGFDLECGLKSSFSSFFTARNSCFAHDADSNETNPLGFKRNLWDVILGSMDGDRWADVEGAIAQWIVSTGRKDTNPKYWKSMLDETIGTLREIACDKKSTFRKNSITDNVALYLCGGSPQKARQWDKERLQHLTYDALKSLEDEFARYLTQAEKNESSYRDEAAKLMCEIILQGRPKEEDFNIEESVLSFNYTHPIENLHSKEHVTSYVNIHGRLGGEIVFGIDGTGRMNDPIITPYTKTYRLMNLNVKNTRSLVHVPSSAESQDYGTSLIKFYGHSLGSADYSYFQAIFDSIHLYESQTQLVFFYRKHGKKTLEEVRTETMHQVIRLLDAYGRTLDNKDHGKNLIHKLLIEGRLVVKELPNTVVRGS